MPNENDEVTVSYFAICDQVITEAQTGKQSLIGIYSSLMGEQFPLQANLSVALGIRVQSPRERELTLRLTGPGGEQIFASPKLPLDWQAITQGLRGVGFASAQIGVNLRAIPLRNAGVYTVAVYCDGALLAASPLAVSLMPPTTN